MPEHLSEDFWPEILQWLPVKSLLRFRCVCKSWNSIISSSSFIADHLSCSSTNPRLLARHTSQFGENYLVLDYDENDVTYIPEFDARLIDRKCSSYAIVGTVNGVVCLATRGADDEVWCPNFGLWNPLIRKYIRLPRNRVSVACVDPPPWFGFGFKASEDDFRVLFVTCEDDDEEEEDDPSLEVNFRVQICSVRRRRWRNLPAEILSECTIEEGTSRCLLNGVLHQVAFNGVQTLLLFDFEQEVFSFMDLPEGVSASVDVAVYKSKLAALDYDYGKDVPTCKIWAMSEYGDPKSWVCVISVYLSPLSRTLIENKETIAGFTTDGRIIIARENGVFIMRDPVRRKRRWLGLKHSLSRIYACGFVESLVFLDGKSKAKTLPKNLFYDGGAVSDGDATDEQNQDMDECDNDYEDDNDYEFYEGDGNKGDGNVGGDDGR